MEDMNINSVKAKVLTAALPYKKINKGFPMNVILILFLYVIIVNIVGFAMMGIDKRKAKRGAFRIPEANLFLTALVGGSIGCIAGMYTFRHKTKHKSFVFGMPAILIVQLAVILYLLFAAPVHFTLM